MNEAKPLYERNLLHICAFYIHHRDNKRSKRDKIKIKRDNFEKKRSNKRKRDNRKRPSQQGFCRSMSNK